MALRKRVGNARDFRKETRMNVEVEEKWQVAKNNLLQMIGNQQPVSCLISGWEPVDLETGLRWLLRRIHGGLNCPAITIG